jgi:anti-sigma regulatory factor (Ser/Thr protein kinase)
VSVSHCIRLKAVPENVPRARHFVEAQAVELGLSEQRRADLSIAVTEAVANAVRHAYRSYDEPGDVEIALGPDGDKLFVVVRDDGVGPGANPESEGIGMGVKLMGAVAEDLVVEGAPGRGVRVRMTFLLQ